MCNVHRYKSNSPLQPAGMRLVYLVEVFERVLVHGVDFGQLGDDKVDDTAASGHRPILFAGGRYLDLSRLGLRQTDTDVARRYLARRRHICRTDSFYSLKWNTDVA